MFCAEEDVVVTGAEPSPKSHLYVALVVQFKPNPGIVVFVIKTLDPTHELSATVNAASGFDKIEMFPKVNGVVPQALVTFSFTWKLLAGQLLVT